jgi:hypothetical protein
VRVESQSCFTQLVILLIAAASTFPSATCPDTCVLLPASVSVPPVSCIHSASSFSEAMRMGAEVYHNLKNLIKDKYGEWGLLRRGGGAIRQQQRGGGGQGTHPSGWQWGGDTATTAAAAAVKRWWVK